MQISRLKALALLKQKDANWTKANNVEFPKWRSEQIAAAKKRHANLIKAAQTEASVIKRMESLTTVEAWNNAAETNRGWLYTYHAHTSPYTNAIKLLTLSDDETVNLTVNLTNLLS